MSNPDIKIKSFRLCEGKTSVLQIGILLLVALFFIGLIGLTSWWVDKEMRENNISQTLDINKRGNRSEIINVPAEQVPANKVEVPKGFSKEITEEKKEQLRNIRL